MKTKIIVLITLIGFNINLLANSPLKITEISKAYINVPIVITATESKGELTLELMSYLKNKKNPIAVKMAIINELGIYALENFTNDSVDLFGLEVREYRQGNSAIFYEYLNKNKKYSNIDDFLNKADGDIIICMAYLKAMDYNNINDDALLFAEKAKIKNPNSYTIHIISSLIEAEQIIDNEKCLVYKLANGVRNNKQLNKDMNEEAIEIIFKYIDFYKDDCKMNEHSKIVLR